MKHHDTDSSPGRRLHGGVGAVAGVGLLLSFGLAGESPAHQDLGWKVQFLTQQLREDPGNAQLYLKRGQTSLRNGDLHQADLDFDTAEALDPDRPEIHWARAQMLSQMGEHAECVLSLNQFLATAPDHLPALLLRAESRVNLGQKRQALGDFERAQLLHGFQSPSPCLAQADLLRELGRPREAVAVLDTGIAQLGPAITLILRAVELERALGDFDAALARIELLAKKSPRKDHWLLLQGRLHREAGRHGEARRCFALALSEIESLPPHLRLTPSSETLKSQITELVEQTPIPHDPT